MQHTRPVRIFRRVKKNVKIPAARNTLVVLCDKSRFRNVAAAYLAEENFRILESLRHTGRQRRCAEKFTRTEVVFALRFFYFDSDSFCHSINPSLQIS